tara:strand:+ start:384 stop:1010 length:627 start_codon:yes stop_codon:yes gene_type:complete
MLHTLLEELNTKYKDHSIVVIDDGSDYNVKPYLNLCDYHRLEHNGKEKFYVNWSYCFRLCEDSKDNFFMFLPDDFSQIDSERINTIYETHKELYAYNLLNDGRPTFWTPVKPTSVTVAGIESIQTSYVDGGYFTNRRTLERISFIQDYVISSRFVFPNISSGVGETQSRKYWKSGIPMYIPNKSMCYHGTHDSVMHYELRKKQPLVSL